MLRNLAEIYLTEKKTTADYRLEKFKKKYNYDPKTKTIEKDGERVRFNYVNGSKSHKANIVAEFDPKTGMKMNRDAFNYKHKNTHEFIANHELGHKQYIKNYREAINYDSYKDGSVSVAPPSKYTNELKKIVYNYRMAQKNGDEEKQNLYGNKLMTYYNSHLTPKEKKITDFYKLFTRVNQLISEYDVKTSHGSDPSEYMADHYAMNHSGKDKYRKSKNALNDLSKDNKNYKKKLVNHYRDNVKSSYAEAKYNIRVKEKIKTALEQVRSIKNELNNLIKNNADESKINRCKDSLKEAEYTLSKLKKDYNQSKKDDNVYYTKSREESIRKNDDVIKELEVRKKILKDLNK